MLRRLLPAVVLLVAAAPSLADPLAGDVVRLTPAEREAALEAGAAHGVDDLPVNGLAGRVHGEIGTEIGSGGERALYGSAALPLGETGSASFSFFTGQSGRGRGH